MSTVDTLQKYHKEIAHLKASLPEWNSLDNNRIQLQRLSGLTNITFRVTDTKGQLKSLIFKKYCKVEGIIAREHENRISMQGSNRGIGPKCYYANNEFRIEEDLSGAIHPSNNDLQDLKLIKRVMGKMATFHKIELEAIKSMPLFADYILSSDYINQAKATMATKQFSLGQQPIVDHLLSYLDEGKLLYLREKLLPGDNALVRLCHNDLNNLNIMNKGSKTYLIDYEYSRYNYVAFDIANFLSQSSINYEKDAYPYFQFLEEYFPTSSHILQVCELYLSQINPQVEVEENLLRQLAENVEKCYGLCNFYWAVWSPITKNEEIQFGYMEHAEKRLERLERVLKNLNNKEI